MIKEFRVHQNTINAIRPMKKEDIRRKLNCTTQLWETAFGHNWGKIFGMHLSRTPRASVFFRFVYEENQWIEGFIAGSEQTDTMMEEIFATHMIDLGLATGIGLIRNFREHHNS